MEKYAGKEPSFTKKAKRLESRGEWWVLVGIFIEIVSTVAFAVRGEIEMRHITEAEVKNDPINRPVAEISGTASVIFKNPIDMAKPKIGEQYFAILTLGNTNSMDANSTSSIFDNLYCASIPIPAKWGNTNGQTGFWYDLEFKENKAEEMMAGPAGEPVIPVRNAAENINMIRIVMMPQDNEVIFGHAKITFNNGVTNKDFDISRQKSATPTWFTFLATNSLNTNRLWW